MSMKFSVSLKKIHTHTHKQMPICNLCMYIIWHQCNCLLICKLSDLNLSIYCLYIWALSAIFISTICTLKSLLIRFWNFSSLFYSWKFLVSFRLTFYLSPFMTPIMWKKTLLLLSPISFNIYFIFCHCLIPSGIVSTLVTHYFLFWLYSFCYSTFLLSFLFSTLFFHP